MSLAVLEDGLRQLLSNKTLEGLDILWLTGEPLVMGIAWFRDAVEICKRVCGEKLPLSFIVQTNGTLVNDEWCRFFAEHNFVVGVSLDGPPEIHDAQRRTRQNASTSTRVEEAVALLTKHKVRGGAICVITRETLRHSPDELFNYFASKGIAWSYLIEAGIGDNANNSSVTYKNEEDLTAYLDRLLDLWGANPGSYIRDFEQTSRRIFGGSRPGIGDDNLGCLDILNFCSDGDFYWGNPELMSASHHGLKQIRFNLCSDNVWHSRKTDAFKKYRRQVHQGIQKCREECAFFEGCQGGNPAHKYYEFGRFDVSSHTSCILNDKIIQRLMVAKALKT